MFVFKGNGLLVSSKLPLQVAQPERVDYHRYGDLQVALTDDDAPAGFEYRDMRFLGVELDAETLKQAALALQMVRWDTNSRFCGRCGAENRYDPVENGKLCPSCMYRQYPAQFPVAIVAVTRDNKLLLAHNANFPDGLFSVIAGYVDLGETIEETVHREVMEEVGLKIYEPRYFGSQNWAPSSALMLGFQAEWAGGEIQVDGKEITEAAWFGRDELPPNLPRTGSIGRRLIEAFRNS